MRCAKAEMLQPREVNPASVHCIMLKMMVMAMAWMVMIMMMITMMISMCGLDANHAALI